LRPAFPAAASAIGLPEAGQNNLLAQVLGESGEDGADFLDAERRILARASVTELFSPRGLGKSLFALSLSLKLAQCGRRVMYVDRDNPRHAVRTRLKSFGAETTTPGLKIISREKCPPLTKASAWARCFHTPIMTL